MSETISASGGDAYRPPVDVQLGDAGIIPQAEALQTAEGIVGKGIEGVFCIAISGELGQLSSDPAALAEFTHAVRQVAPARPGEDDLSFLPSVVVSRLWVDQSLVALARFGDAIAKSNDPLQRWRSALLDAADVPRMELLPDQHDAGDVAAKRMAVEAYAEATWSRRQVAGRFPDELRDAFATNILPVWYQVNTQEGGLSSAMNSSAVCGVCAGRFRAEVNQVAEKLLPPPAEQ